jgi:NodT family efflux transporter outer membrane factor (OMF) lipoprotein
MSCIRYYSTPAARFAAWFLREAIGLRNEGNAAVKRATVASSGPRTAASFALVALVLSLVACTTETVVPDLPNDLPKTWSHAKGEPDAAITPALDAWWKAFQDPALDQLVSAAQQGNLTLEMATERLKAARQLHHRTRADFWPNLNFRVYPETAPGGSTGYLELGFDSTWELGLFGRSTGNARISAADVNSASIDEAAAQISVVAEVARTYVELCAARARVRLAGDIAAARRRQYEIAQTRLSLHIGSSAEANRAGAEWRAAASDVTDAAVPVAESEAALSVLLGIPAATMNLPAADAVPRFGAAVVPEPPADLVRTRPEIRRAEQNVLRAAGELGIARADLYPRFSIVGTLISSTALTGDVDHPNKAVPLIGPSFTLPIIDWHARRAVVNAREAALTAAVLAYREAVLEGAADVETALVRSQAKTALLTDADDAVDSAERARKIAARSREIGVIDDSELTAARVALSQAQLQRLQAQRDSALAYISLYKAFGGTMPALVAAP